MNKKVKNINRVLLLSISLIIFCLASTACVHKSGFKKGFEYTLTPGEIMLGVSSDTDTFHINNVNLELSYGVHDIGYDEKYNTNPKWSYQKEGDETIFFGLYICDSRYNLDVLNDMLVTDYTMIENHYFVGEISEEEAFSEEYGFMLDYWKGITYNHSERIAVPRSFLEDDSGSFVIKLIAFREPSTVGDCYCTASVGYIEFDYQAVDENTIRIIF